MINGDEPLWLTAMETWNSDLRDLLGPHGEVPLTQEDLALIGSATPGFIAPDRISLPRDFSTDFLDDLTSELAEYGTGAHLRLGVCSFKTSNGVSRVRDVAGARAMMLRPNIRVANFALRLLEAGRHASLFLFPWYEIPPWAEFRVFFRGRNVVGASQMPANAVYSEIAAEEDRIRNAIIATCYRLRPLLPADDIIADLWVEINNHEANAHLIELNPFGATTDPGLFSWRNSEDFDGTFRFNRVSGH